MRSMRPSVPRSSHWLTALALRGDQRRSDDGMQHRPDVAAVPTGDKRRHRDRTSTSTAMRGFVSST